MKRIPRTLTAIRKKVWTKDWALMKPVLKSEGPRNDPVEDANGGRAIRYSEKVKRVHNWQKLGNLGIM